MPKAPWENHLNDEEKQRLALLRERMERLVARKFDISKEVARMMNRAIHRMRRDQGKR